MAKLVAGVPAGFDRIAGESFDAYYVRQTQALDKLTALAAALPEGEVVGQLLQFPVADGYAHYVVVKESPLSLQHIPFGDGYQIDPAHIRGIRKQDVLEHARRAKAIAKLFASRTARA